MESKFLFIAFILFFFSFIYAEEKMSNHVGVGPPGTPPPEYTKTKEDKDILKQIMAENELYNDLMDDYNPDIRPAPNDSSPVNVYMKIQVTDVIEVDAVGGYLTVAVYISADWDDPRFIWDEKFSNLTTLDSLIISRRVWIPELGVINSRSYEKQMNVFEYRVRVRRNGRVEIGVGGTLSVACYFNMRYFPYDENNCTIKLRSMKYHSSELKLIPKVAFFKLPDEQYFHSEFEIRRSAIKARTSYIDWPDSNYGYPEMWYTMILKRRPGYYTYMFTLPAFILMFLVPFVFLQTPNSGEKITLGGFILLSIVLMLMMLDEFLPKSHYNIPILVQYYATTMVLVSISIALSSIVSNLGRRGQRNSRIPQLTKKILLSGLNRILLVDVDSSEPYSKFEESVSAHNISERDDTPIMNQEVNPHLNSENEEQMIRCLRALLRRNAILDVERDLTNEWILVAIVIDRLLFIIFIVTIVICNIAMLS